MSKLVLDLVALVALVLVVLSGMVEITYLAAAGVDIPPVLAGIVTGAGGVLVGWYSRSWIAANGRNGKG